MSDDTQPSNAASALFLETRASKTPDPGSRSLSNTPYCSSLLDGKDVLVVEDIVDTGLTLRFLREYLLPRHPASLRVAALLDKPSRRQVDVPIDYLGFAIPDRFVVGMGLDFNERYRNLRDICVLRPEVYAAGSHP